MVLGLGQQFEDPRFSAQNAINLQRREVGLDRLGENDPNVLRAQQHSDFQTQAQPIVREAVAGVDARAQNTLSQIKQAGLAGVADQFRRSQRNIAFETARRGTLGGSRSIERNQGAQNDAQNSIGGVLNQASQAAENQRSQELAPVFGFQQELAGGDPFAQTGLQNQLAGIQQQGQSATGQFDLTQQLENIRAGTAMNRAGFINNAISGVGQGLGGFVDSQSRNKQLLSNDASGFVNQSGGIANPLSNNFVGPRR